MSWLDEVKRFNKPYYKWTLETRKKFLNTELRAERKLALEIEEAAADLTRYMKKLPKDHAAQMKYVQEGLREFAKELRGVQKQTLTDGIEKAAAIGVEYSRRMTRDVFGPVLPLVEKELENVFGAVQDDVIKAMWNRRLAGLQLSDRIWKISKSNADAIGRIVLSGIAENMDIVDIANALEEYVQEGARTIAKDYPNMMKRMGKRLPANLNYEALRLVRTEVSAAHGDALIRSAAYNPACKGVKWVLSSEHPEYDICDELANANIGYGAGVYPVDQAPPMPAHPNCLCFFIEVLEEPEQFTDRLIKFIGDPSSDPLLRDYWGKTFGSLEVI